MTYSEYLDLFSMVYAILCFGRDAMYVGLALFAIAWNFFLEAWPYIAISYGCVFLIQIIAAVIEGQKPTTTITTITKTTYLSAKDDECTTTP